MKITFYKTTDDRRVVNKTLTSITGLNTIDMTIKGAVNLDNPEFILSYTSKIGSANYFVLDDSGKAYFMDEPEVTTGGRMIIRGKLDVLYTYRNELKKLPAIVARAEKYQNVYLNDAQLPMQQNEDRDLKYFKSNALTKNLQFILVVGGGVV